MESWRQTMLKLIEENSLLTKKVKNLEKKLAKTPKKPSGKSKN